MRILVAYRAIPRPTARATGDHVVKALRALGHEAAPYAHLYCKEDEWLPRELSGEPDLLLYLECNDADPQYLELVNLPCRKVYWEFDTAMHLDFSRGFTAAMRFDRCFTANRLLAPQLGWGYLPYAVDAEQFAGEHADTDDVALVGTPFKERVAFCSEAGVQIISGIYDEEYADKLRSLAIHVHHYPSGGKGLIVARPFETMAAGACLLAERDEGLEQLFVPGRHYVSFDSPQDCRELVAYLLARPDERKAIARAGRHAIETGHTYEHRVRALLAAIGAA